MNLGIVLMLFSVLIWPFNYEAHDFYVSVTSIRHNLEKKKINIRIKLFANDLEKSFLDEKGFGLSFWKNSPIENTKYYIEKYINSKFYVSINEKPINLNFLEQKFENTELLDEGLVIYELEAINISKIYSIRVKNNFLIESFDSQTNIVFITANGKKMSLNLNKRIPEGYIDY